MVLGMGQRSVIGSVFVLMFAAVGRDAAAQPPMQATTQSVVGFHGGGSIDPEQLFVGVFWQSPPIANRFHIRPGIDGGFGNDLRLATINVDFIARFPLGNSRWTLIQGGGPVIVLTRIPDIDVSDVSAGGSYVLGFSHDTGFFSEFRIGGGNVPNLKVGAGYQIKF